MSDEEGALVDSNSEYNVSHSALTAPPQDLEARGRRDPCGWRDSWKSLGDGRGCEESFAWCV